MMISATEAIWALDTIDSMNTIEFDVDEGLFRAAYDGTCDLTSLAVVAVIATAEKRDPRELEPLHNTIDTDALDSLFSTTPNGGQRSGCISFPYEGFEVTVFDGETIEAVPLQTT